MNKKTKIILAILIAALIVTISTVIAITIVSNSIQITPQSAPTLTLTVSTQTPIVGNQITLTATLSNGASGVSVTFLKDGSSIGTVSTVSGVATFTYTIPDATSWTASASCVI